MALLRRTRVHRFNDFVRDRSNVRSILVLRNGLMGDVVFATAVIRALQSSFPLAAVDAAVSERSAALLNEFPFLRHVHGIPEGTSLAREAGFYASLRPFRYDIVVLLESNSHYALMSALVGGRFVVGFGSSLDMFLDVPVPWNNGVHAVLAELESVRGWTDPAIEPAMMLEVSAQEADAADRRLNELGIPPGRPVICIHPGCNEPDSPRQWSGERYAGLASALSGRHQAPVVFTGTGKDRSEIEGIRSLINGQSVNLAGETSVREFMAILRRAAIVVGPDTGALHIAVALGTPVVMLMGFTDPADTGPFDASGRSRIVRVGLPCSPCMPLDPKPLQWETCKLRRPVLCMDLLTVEAVLEACSGILRQPAMKS